MNINAEFVIDFDGESGEVNFLLMPSLFAKSLQSCFRIFMVDCRASCDSTLPPTPPAHHPAGSSPRAARANPEPGLLR